MRVNILDYRSSSKESQDWTKAFEKAVEILEEMGGGTLFVPAGSYSTRSIELKSNMTLYLEAGSIINFMDDYEHYKLVDSEFEGKAGMMYMPLIYADHAENVTVAGYGTLNGNGSRWWKEKKTLKYFRPYLICFQYCSRVKVEGIVLRNSPVWTIHPLYCFDVTIHGVSINNPSDSPNTDGINPNSCSNVRISDCYIDVGDDCIAIKAGTEHTPVKRPCENITITNCNMIHGHGGIVLGSEMSGGIRNVTVSNCVFRNTDRGIRMKSRRLRGGTIERLTFQNIIMDNVLCPFTFNLYYCCGTGEEDKHVWEKTPYPVGASTPAIRDVSINNIIVNRATAAAGFLYGLAEQPVENVTFSNCNISMDTDGEPGMPDMLGKMEPVKAAGFFLRNARNIVFHNVRITNVQGELIDKDDTVELKDYQ